MDDEFLRERERESEIYRNEKQAHLKIQQPYRSKKKLKKKKTIFS